MAFGSRAPALRRGLIMMLFLSAFTFSSGAAEVPISETNLDIPEDLSLWTESMLWDKQIAVWSGVGYQDNVFLSAFNPHASPFVINGLDMTVLRVPLDGWQLVGVLSGDYIRFWRDIGTNSEASLISSVRVQRQLPGDCQAALEFRGLYEKEVLDVSTLESAAATTLVEGYGITAQPSVRKNLPAGLWLQVEMPVTRWSLAAPLDDYWDFGPIATVGWNISQYTDLTASYAASYQPHDQWVALDSYGQPLPRHLEIFQDRTEFAWRQYCDPHRHLRLSSRFVFAYDQDNGGGYFNYYQYQFIEDLLWQSATWQVKGSAQQVYELYPVQGVGILNGQFLNRNLLDLSLELERRVFKSLKTFAKLEYHRGHSNYTGDAGDYFARTYSCGLRFEF